MKLNINNNGNNNFHSRSRSHTRTKSNTRFNSRNRSNSRGNDNLCYYHKKFNDMARKCKPYCKNFKIFNETNRSV